MQALPDWGKSADIAIISGRAYKKQTANKSAEGKK